MMGMHDKIGRILVAIDGSTKANEALSLALYIASNLGAEVEIFNVIVAPAYPIGASVRLGGSPPGYIHNYYAEHKEYSEKLIKEAFEKSKKDYPKLTITTKISEGNPADTILEESEKGFDALVIGSRGLGFMDELLLGSVSGKVIHKSKITVILSK